MKHYIHTQIINDTMDRQCNCDAIDNKDEDDSDDGGGDGDGTSGS